MVICQLIYAEDHPGGSLDSQVTVNFRSALNFSDNSRILECENSDWVMSTYSLIRIYPF
jgi:hypothetical protein